MKTYADMSGLGFKHNDQWHYQVVYTANKDVNCNPHISIGDRVFEWIHYPTQIRKSKININLIKDQLLGYE